MAEELTSEVMPSVVSDAVSWSVVPAASVALPEVNADGAAGTTAARAA